MTKIRKSAHFFVAYLTVWLAVNWVGVHYLILLLIVALSDSLMNDKKAIDRILICSVSILGFVPFFGWLKWTTLFDPLVVVISVWSVVLFRARVRDIREIKPALALVPAGLGGAAVYQWWRGISKGSPAEVLERLAPLWDSSSHFLFFFSNLSQGRFIAMLPTPGEGLTWAGREYPSGIHYVWSRFAATSRETIQLQPDRAIPIFANSVVATVAVSVLIVGLSFARLGASGPRRLSYSFVGTGACVSVIALGPLSQTIYAGFSNMSAVLIGVVVFASFFLRPVPQSQLQFWILGCATLTVLYNWYPIALLLIPALASSFYGFLRRESKPRVILLGLLFSLLGTPPILQTLSLGIEHVEEPGGVQPFPPGVLAFVLLLSFSLSLVAAGMKDSWRVTVLNFTPLLFVLAFGIYLESQTGTYPYYFHKASLMVGSSAALFALMSMIALFEEWNPSQSVGRQRIRGKVFSTVGASFLGLGLTYSFGYWGIGYPALSGTNTSIGVLTRNEITKGGTEFLPLAQLVVSRANKDLSLATKEKSCLTLLVPERIGAQEGSKYGPWTLTLYNVWYHSLTSSYTLQAMEQAYMSPNVAPAAGNEADFVSAIEKTYDPSSVCIYSTDKVINELRQRSDRWTLKSLED